MTHSLVYSASGPLAEQRASEKVMLLIVCNTRPGMLYLGRLLRSPLEFLHKKNQMVVSVGE